MREDREESGGGGAPPAQGARPIAVAAGKGYAGLPPAPPPRAPPPAAAKTTGGSRVYVGNLSWETSWQTLKDHFRQAGEVIHADVLMQEGRSKGCGIVAFATPAEAAHAIETLTESELDGRNVFVREDREESVGGLPAPATRNHAPPNAPAFGVGLPPPRAPAPRPMPMVQMGAVAANGGGGETRVYVGNLSWQTSWQTLKDHFRQAGDVLHADVMMQEGRSKGCGIVAFASPAAAANAIETLTESELDGRNIFVREDREAPPQQHMGGRPMGGGGARYGAPSAPTAGCQVYVGNLPWTATWQVKQKYSC